MKIKGFGISIHDSEQWDLNCFPIVCIHLYRRNSCSRIFCLWNEGIQVGKWLYKWKA